MTNQKFTSLVLWATIGTSAVLAQQPTFSSTADACHSLFQAVQSNDVQSIAKILGGPTELASSRDDAADKVERELFLEKYQQMHRLSPDPDGSVTIYIGAENWPFPVPLVQKDGAWRFDPDAGSKEVLYRRIGEHELAAIATCHEYVAKKKQNATAALTSSGADSTPDQPVLLNGYYFRAINSPKAGGFALIAYPAEYRSSGVMTFAVTDRDVVYEKDLGTDSSSLANAMTAFKKDGSWYAAEGGK
jgi:hypothetical protein